MARTCRNPGYRWSERIFFNGYRNRTLLEAAEILRHDSSEEQAADNVVEKNSVLGGEPREYFKLNKGDPVPKEEEFELDAAPHLSEFEQQRA